MNDTGNTSTIGSQSARGLAPVDPTWTYSLPQQVLDDTQLTTDEKRSILAGWASDALAVEDHPALRRLPWSERLLSIDELLEALRSLDHQVGQFASSPTRRLVRRAAMEAFRAAKAHRRHIERCAD